MSTQIETPVQAISKSFDLHIDTQKQMTALLGLIQKQDDNIRLMTNKIERLERLAILNDKIMARYQMTEGADEHRNNS
tara:strand:+ start:108 stop:341 length:234 start_codon:yes stop_codon:yes gene_type:complete